MNKIPEARRAPGRPSRPTGSRERILDVARGRFLAEGYTAVTLRSIAAEAGVDVALVSHHYQSKAGLFAAVVQLAANPAAVVRDALDAPLEDVPRRLLSALVSTWDAPGAGASLRALAEAALREPEVRRALTEVVERELLARIAARIGGPEATARAATAITQLSGIVFARYILALDPVALLPAAELVWRSEPALRSALAGPPPQRRTTAAANSRPQL